MYQCIQSDSGGRLSSVNPSRKALHTVNFVFLSGQETFPERSGKARRPHDGAQTTIRGGSARGSHSVWHTRKSTGYLTMTGAFSLSTFAFVPILRGSDSDAENARSVLRHASVGHDNNPFLCLGVR